MGKVLGERVSFISIRSLAERWSVSQATVYRIIKAADLPVVVIGCSKRVLLESVIGYESHHRLQSSEVSLPAHIKTTLAETENSKKVVARLRNTRIRRSAKRASKLA